MKKNPIKILLFVTYSLLTINLCNWIVVQIPPNQWQENVIVTWPTQIQSDEWTIFELIQKINQYLRFFIWAICMWVLVFWWIRLMTAQWDQEKIKKTSKLLTWALVWIIIAILSYAVVRLIINLF